MQLAVCFVRLCSCRLELVLPGHDAQIAGGAGKLQRDSKNEARYRL